MRELLLISGLITLGYFTEGSIDLVLGESCRVYERMAHDGGLPSVLCLSLDLPTAIDSSDAMGEILNLSQTMQPRLPQMELMNCARMESESVEAHRPLELAQEIRKVALLEPNP